MSLSALVTSLVAANLRLGPRIYTQDGMEYFMKSTFKLMLASACLSGLMAGTMAAQSQDAQQNKTNPQKQQSNSQKSSSKQSASQNSDSKTSTSKTASKDKNSCGGKNGCGNTAK